MCHTSRTPQRDSRQQALLIQPCTLSRNSYAPSAYIRACPLLMYKRKQMHKPYYANEIVLQYFLMATSYTVTKFNYILHRAMKTRHEIISNAQRSTPCIPTCSPPAQNHTICKPSVRPPCFTMSNQHQARITQEIFTMKMLRSLCHIILGCNTAKRPTHSHVQHSKQTAPSKPLSLAAAPSCRRCCTAASPTHYIVTVIII